MKPDEIFREEVERLKKENINWAPKTLQSASSNRSVYDNKEVILLCSNNYLGLANHPKLIQASIEATKKYGAGSGAVRPISGTMELHLELERKIAKFKKTEAALFYQSGFAVNAGLIPAILQDGWLVVSDELNHGSIIDGIRLSKAEKAVYKHCDMESLRNVMKEHSKKNYKAIMIITDGVFSMDGDIAPLDEIYEIAQEYNAMTYVDDAHGDGVLGENGRGAAFHFGLHGKIDVEIGTFSKAFGTVGGYISGSKNLREYALNKSRTWLLSGSHPPGVVASCIAAIDVLESEPQLVKNLWKNREFFIKGLKDLGFDTGFSQTPIVPVMLKDSGLARKFSQRLFDEGVYALPIVFPMVAKDKARIRNQVSAAHTLEDLKEALNAYEKIGKELNVI
ncbi:MAG TPA: glycine C-acetyltransferase [Candidatus Nanoarchaeia archaeon]|nr:glycine C-acetyltransferase [Candidatus Nanoarchaeia archaeon]